jgi:hypothetical protein
MKTYKNRCKKGVRYRENRQRRDDWKDHTHTHDRNDIYIYMMTLEYTNRKKRRKKHIYLRVWVRVRLKGFFLVPKSHHDARAYLS